MTRAQLKPEPYELTTTLPTYYCEYFLLLPTECQLTLLPFCLSSPLANVGFYSHSSPSRSRLGSRRSSPVLTRSRKSISLRALLQQEQETADRTDRARELDKGGGDKAAKRFFTLLHNQRPHTQPASVSLCLRILHQPAGPGLPFSTLATMTVAHHVRLGPNPRSALPMSIAFCGPLIYLTKSFVAVCLSTMQRRVGVSDGMSGCSC